MSIDARGIMRMPKQEVKEGEKHGYIGEDTGEVEVYEAPKPGDSNTAPDLATAKTRVKLAEIELAKAEKSLAEAAKADKAKKPEEPKRVVGDSTPPTTPPTKPETPPQT